MSQMVRKQIYIEKEQEKELRRKAKEMGVSEVALIRQGINSLGAGVLGKARDVKAWKDELAYMRKRAKMKMRQTERQWNREELYEERLQRISHR